MFEKEKIDSKFVKDLASNRFLDTDSFDSIHKSQQSQLNDNTDISVMGMNFMQTPQYKNNNGDN